MFRILLIISLLFFTHGLFAQKDSLSYFLQSAKSAEQNRQTQQALNFYLKAAFIEENSQEKVYLSTTYERIGNLYQGRGLYQKALDYFLQANKLAKQNNDEGAQMRLLQALGASQYALKDLNKAAENYQDALQKAKETQNKGGIASILGKLFLIEEARQNYDKAVLYAEESLLLYENTKQPQFVSSTLNNIGFLYRKKGDYKKSEEAFSRSLETNKQILSSQSGESRAITLLNIGVIYTNLEDEKNAIKAFNEALAIRERTGRPGTVAETQNYIARHYLVTDYYDRAETSANAAVTNAQKARDYKNLADAYQTLAEVYRKTGNFKRSDEYARLKSVANDSLSAQKEIDAQKNQKVQIAAEREESEFRLLLAERQKQELIVKQITLEAEKNAKEIEINKQAIAALEKDKKLQQADRERQIAERLRIQQDLVIAQQRLMNEKKQQELIAVQKEQALQALALEQQKRKSNEAEAQKEKAQAANKLAEAEKEKEKENSRFILYAAAAGAFLSLIIIVLVLWSVINKSRANRVLEAQKKELEVAATKIQEQNDMLVMSEEELRQNMEELEAQRDALQSITNRLELANIDIQGKNDELAASEEELRQNVDALNVMQEALLSQTTQLSLQNQNILASIHYAKRIQTAILPSVMAIQTVFADSFILYKPRDVVAGDFYWLSNPHSHYEHDTVIMAVGDCTGHGVPGAFMTLIGNTILNQIVNESDVYQPHQILWELDKRLVDTLKQDSESFKVRDGMDISVMAYQKKINKVTFSSAKRPVWHFQSGDLIEYKGSKSSIGGTFEESKKFELCELTLREKNETKQDNDVIYMFTDGYVDQFGGDDNKRLMTKKFRELLKSVQDKEMKEQGEYLDTFFESWRGEEKQLDDVLVVGIKL